MTAEPVPSAPAPAAVEPFDVVMAAGELASTAPVWLLVTGIDGEPGGTFTARPPDPGRAGSGIAGPAAFGGDVLIELGAARYSGPDAATVTVTVHAVVAGQLVLLTTVESAAVPGWPEQARPAVKAAMDIVTVLAGHADLRETVPVSLGDPARVTADAG